MITRLRIFLNELLLRVIRKMIVNEGVRSREAEFKIAELEVRRDQVIEEIAKLKRKKRRSR